MKPIIAVAFFMAFVTLAGGAAADETTADLVNSLLLLRSATIDQIPSGSGIAVVSGSSYNSVTKMSALSVSPATHSLRFRFLRDTSLVENFSGTDTNADNRVSATIVRNGRVVRYSDSAKAVSIFAFHPEWTLLMLEPVRCSYRDLCRIPDYSRDDDTGFLRGIVKKGQATRNGNQIIVSRSVEFPDRNYHRSWYMVFDTGLGGMLVDWKSEQSITGENGTPVNQRSEIKFQWVRKGDVVVPVSREIDVVNVDAADPSKVYLSGNLKIQFTEFDVSDLSLDDFDVASLNISPGASVINQITDEQFRYSPDDLQTHFFGGVAEPTTLKAEGP